MPSHEIISNELPVLDCLKKPQNPSISSETPDDNVEIHNEMQSKNLSEISSGGILVLADTDTYSITATFAPEDKNSNPSHENNGKEFSSDDNIDLDLEVTEEEEEVNY